MTGMNVGSGGENIFPLGHISSEAQPTKSRRQPKQTQAQA